MSRIISFLLIFTAIVANGRRISPEEAQAIASEFFNSATTSKVKKVPRQACRALRVTENQTDFQPYYIFNASDNAGFVIVSGDTRAKKIIGYSNKGDFNTTNFPPQLEWLLGEYEKKLKAFPSSAAQDESWQNDDAPSSEGALLETANWGQGYPYNALCPKIDGVQAPTGCVATAMAIVMKYHNWPEKGKNEHHYYTNDGEVSYNFDNFRPAWDRMLNTYEQGSFDESNVAAVSELMYAAGVASNMQYTATESGTGVLGLMTSLKRYFNYSSSMKEVMLDEYEVSDWTSLIKNDINNKKPIFYYGNGTGAHAFVIDGYGDDDFFHINWGWEGASNGYFELNALFPHGFDFSERQGMITEMCPATNDENVWSDFFMADDKYFGSLPIKQINVSVENIQKDIPFSVTTPYVIFPPFTTCNLGLALIDKDNNIKQVLSHKSWSSVWENITGTNPSFENLVVNCEVNDTDRLQLIVKEVGTEEWKFVCNNHQVLSSVGVIGNTPLFANAHWEVDPRLEIEFFDDHGNRSDFFEIGADMNQRKSKLLCGLRYEFHPLNVDAANNIFSAILVNDKMQSICVNKKFTMTNHAIGLITPEPIDYNIKIMALFPGDEKSDSFMIQSPGEFDAYIHSKICNHITNFSLSGLGDDDDYKLIFNNMPFISSLNLKKYMPKGNNLPDYCFAGLSNLSKVVLPDEVTHIGFGSFADCALESITIPENVVSIDSFAFNSEVSLSAVFCKALLPPDVGQDSFGNIAKTTLFVMPGCKEVYQQHPYWGLFPTIIEDSVPIMDTVEVIKEGVRYKLNYTYAEVLGPSESYPEDVVLQEFIEHEGRKLPVTDVAYQAFVYSKIKSLIIPKGIINLGIQAFAGCHDLENLEIYSEIEQLPLWCFEGVSGLKNLKLPASLKRLTGQEITGIVALNDFEIPVSLETIDKSFTINTSKIILPSDNKNFKLYNGCLYTPDMTRLLIMPRLTENEVVNIPEGVKYLNYGLFHINKGVEINLPNSLLELSTEGFESFLPGRIDYKDDLMQSIEYQMEYFVIPDNVINISSRSIPLAKNVIIGKRVGSKPDDPLLNFKDAFATFTINAHSNIYLINEMILPIDEMVGKGIYGCFPEEELNHRIDFYSPYIHNNFTYVDDSYPIEICFHVPGAVKELITDETKKHCREMWDYRINRSKKGINIIVKDPAVMIDKVIINQKEFEYDANGLYTIPGDSEDLDVVVKYTLNNYKSMTTVYDNAFNSKIADSDLIEIKPIQSITFEKSRITVNLGNIVDLPTLVVEPSDATFQTFVWESSDPYVATVEDGKLITHHMGSATISVYSSDGSCLSATFKVEVIVFVDFITLTPDFYQGFPGEAFTIKANVYQSWATNRELKWRNEDESIAKVDSFGVVTLLSPGMTTITAETTDGSGVAANCMVKVEEPTGFADIQIDPDEDVKVFNLQGVLVFEGKLSEVKLSVGTYVIVSKYGSHRKLVK